MPSENAYRFREGKEKGGLEKREGKEERDGKGRKGEREGWGEREGKKMRKGRRGLGNKVLGQGKYSVQ